jgi:UDP-glucose:(heptosyl)LPS alpha-1,3-glucosyltransferase
VICPSRPRTARLLLFALAAPRTIARYRCDIVMSFNRMIKQDLFRSGGGPHVAFLRKMAGDGSWWVPWWHRISPYHRCLLAVEKRQLSAKGSRRIITVSEQGKREIMHYYRVPEERIAVIHNGVDHARFNPRRRHQEGREIRRQLGIPSESPVVLFVGTGFRRKGLDRLLPLWSLPEFRGIYLVVAGNDANLASYRKRWSCDRILFVGPQREIQDYYAAADLFVLPSTQEAFGNAVLEALASGLPVVTVPEVGAAEQIDGELQEGLLTHRDDPEEVKEKVLRMLDRERWPALSEAARVVSERYSWEKYFAELEKELYRVAKGPHEAC